MEKEYFRRENYLKCLRPFYQSDIIKVITGIRRCGKSSLLLTIIEELLSEGIRREDIILIQLDKRGLLGIKKPEKLEKLLEERIKDDNKKYIFLDEVQRVKGYEVIVDAFRAEGHSIFITGSNSYLLSGELSTYLTGRYIEFDIFPLSFAEYLGMKAFFHQKVDNNEFNSYITYGGFPQTLEFSDSEAKQKYVSSVVEQILKKDVFAKSKVRNKALFQKIQTYIFNNFGASMNIDALVDYLNTKDTITKKTVYRYLDLMKKAKLIYECPRFDMKSRKELNGNQKFYLADLSLYYSVNTDNRINFGPALENIVYCYLVGKGYHVSVGRIGKLECDFIIRKNTSYAYIQVAMSIAERNAEEREYRVFQQIRDNWPKYLLTLDPLLQNRDGIKHLNLIEVLQKEYEFIE